MVKNAAPKDPKSVAEETGSAWCSSLPSIFSNEWISNGHCSVRFGVTALRLLSARGQGVEADSMASRTPAHGADGRQEFGRDMEIHV